MIEEVEEGDEQLVAPPVRARHLVRVGLGLGLGLVLEVRVRVSGQGQG